MEWPYEFTPFIWPSLASATCLAVLGLYAFRHRAVPGAVPFIVLASGVILWVLANTLKLTAALDETRIFWFKFEGALALPLVSAALCFALEYAGLGKWLTGRTLVLLSVAPLAFALLVATNEVHHLVWKRIWHDRYVHVEFGPANWCAIAYGYLLSLLHLIVLAWLFARSPRHRWIAGALILTPFVMWASYVPRFVNWRPIASLDPAMLAINLGVLSYALAFFRFHIFHAVPVARDTVIERMPQGMMVLDAGNRIADLNETAQTLLGVVRSKVIGLLVAEALHAHPQLLEMVNDSGATQEEVPFGNTNTRRVQVTLSPLIDRRGFHLGRLILFHDITELKRAQTQLLDRERSLAMLEERELLARELHDGIGQMLAAAHLQAKSAIELLARGETLSAEYHLRRLSEVTQEAKESVRTFLLGVKSRKSKEQDIITALRRYLRQYSQDYGIITELVASPELEEKRIDSAIEAQLQPIIQEALTNARRHGGASSARVIFAPCDNQIRVTVEDDGRGFDPEKISEDKGFGLRSMRGRAEAAGGLLEVNSAPGKGTRVIVKVPWQRQEHEDTVSG